MHDFFEVGVEFENQFGFLGMGFEHVYGSLDSANMGAYENLAAYLFTVDMRLSLNGLLQADWRKRCISEDWKA